MKKLALILVSVLFLTLHLYGGEVSGTTSYSGDFDISGGLAFVFSPGTFDTTSPAPSDTPFTTLDSMGPYTIEGDFSDTVDYYAIAVASDSMLAPGFPYPYSGAPAGEYPDNPFNTTGGVKSGVNISLDTEGSINGEVTFSGSMDSVYINIWDMYGPLIERLSSGAMPGDSTLESTHSISSSTFTLTEIPAGVKLIQAFVDTNDNGSYDSSEKEAFAQTPLGNIAFIGGGSEGDTLTINLEDADISENKQRTTQKTTISASPNPFANLTKISYYLPSQSDVSIVVNNIEGERVANLVDNSQRKGKHTINWAPSKNLQSGQYILELKAKKLNSSKRLLYIK